MSRLHRLSLLLVLHAFSMLLGVRAAAGEGGAPGAIAGARLPVPEARALDAAIDEIRRTFKETYSRREPQALVALASKLIDLGRETRGHPTRAFALLREGRDLAADGGDVDTALRAAEAMSERFAIDPFELKAEALNKAARAVRATEPLGAIAERCLFLVEEAVAADRYEEAVRLAALATTVARRYGKKDSVDAALFTAGEVQFLEREHGLMRKAAKTLLADPADARASFAVGRYLCLAKADLDGAMPRLARGSEEDIGSLARRELVKPEGPLERVALGDLWWGFGAAESSLARERAKIPYRWYFLAGEFRARAVHWYRLALPELSGLEKLRVEERVEALARPVETGLVGLATGGEGERFRELPARGGLLVGVRVSTDASEAVIRSVQPIFLTPAGRVYGKRAGKEKRNLEEVVARPGYAVGGLSVKGRDDRDGVNGFRVIFLRLSGSRLDASDSYESEWFGGRRGGAETKLGGDGRPAVGILGRAGNHLDAIGLLLEP